MVRYYRKTAAQRTAELKAHNELVARLEAEHCKLPVRPYRDYYRTAAVRWGFAPGMVKTRDGVWRLSYVYVNSLGARDWSGSCYTTT